MNAVPIRGVWGGATVTLRSSTQVKRGFKSEVKVEG